MTFMIRTVAIVCTHPQHEQQFKMTRRTTPNREFNLLLHCAIRVRYCLVERFDRNVQVSPSWVELPHPKIDARDVREAMKCGFEYGRPWRRGV
jgi:hypothetical protein